MTDLRPQPKIWTCPNCMMTTYNPNDIREHYCGRCHEFMDDAAEVLSYVLSYKTTPPTPSKMRRKRV